MADTLYKTLVIRLSSVGDIILSSLLIRALRQRFPSAQMDYMVKSEYADLVAHNPHLSRVITLPAGATFRDLRTLRSAVRREAYDLVVDIHDSLRSRFLSLGARRVVRIRKRKIARFLLVHSKVNVYRIFGGAPSVAERYLEPLRPFGVEDDGEGLEVFFSPSDSKRAAEILHARAGDAAMYVGIAPSARHGTKMWLPERFAQAGADIALRHGATILLFGSREETGRCNTIERILRDLAPSVRIGNLAGALSLTETAAVLDRCGVVFTNDSGLMHLAAARRRPVVALFGSTVKEFGFFPFRTEARILEAPGLSCRPCTHIGLASCPLGHFRCMNDIPAAAAIEAAHQLLRAA